MPLLQQLPAKTAQVGGTSLRRALPQRSLRKVGPWVFLDHFGPRDVLISAEHDVRPHPHCGLSTVSYLFHGATEHRDSTGGHAIVRPGEIHWMRGGQGIAHSERAPADRIGTTQRVHGLQLWCAHPDHEERCVYPLDGCVAVDGEHVPQHSLGGVAPGPSAVLAIDATRVVILGGAPISHRYIWWNLVHSDKGRLKEQAERWRRGEFPRVPGDEEAFIPAPDYGP